jgi:uncharacterized cupredoxin-like copper-binding protein
MLGNRRFAALLAVGALVAVPLVGCGGSDNNDNSTNAATTGASTAAAAGGGGGASGGGGSVSLTATDYKFNPSDPTVKAGQVTFTEKNDGQTTHSLEIEDVTPGNDQRLGGDNGEVAPGQSGTLTVNLKPGKYEFYCPILNHKQLGMEGEITVK